MYYLKYRPKNILEIDNTQVKEKVLQLLKSNTIPHAILLAGPKGIGKTSVARIIAKSINCLDNRFNKKNNDVNPCNKCKNCLMIDKSNSVDVVEIDAASKRGIEDVRQLIRETTFFPMTTRYRVFIIDEVHMITQEAFNAFLKTLEEPPEGVIFILATTNPEKIPATIRSRTVIINFGKANKNDILKMLQRIIKGENLNVNEKVLELIVDYSDYSFRDAAKVLEDLVIHNKLDDFQAAQSFLGIVKDDFLKIIAENNINKTLNWLEEFNQAGGDYKRLIEDSLQKLRELLLIKNNIINEKNHQQYSLSINQITILIKNLLEAYRLLKISPIESIPLEIMIIEYYNKIKNKK